MSVKEHFRVCFRVLLSGARELAPVARKLTSSEHAQMQSETEGRGNQNLGESGSPGCEALRVPHVRVRGHVRNVRRSHVIDIVSSLTLDSSPGQRSPSQDQEQ